MITLLGGTKGGTGKSTALVNMATVLGEAGNSVVILDADKQRSSAKWHARRVDAGHQPALALVEERGNIYKTVLDLDERYDHVLVDVAGDDNEEMRTAMLAADIMIVVLRPSQLDVETLEEFTNVIDKGKEMNPELVVRSLISQAPTNHNETETVDVSEFVKEFEQIKPLETVLSIRKAFRDSLPDGRGVVELSASIAKKAQAEVRELVAEVYA